MVHIKKKNLKKNEGEIKIFSDKQKQKLREFEANGLPWWLRL